MKTYIIADAQGRVLTKQGSYSSEVRVPRTYSTVAQAIRFAARYAASVYTVNAPALEGVGYETYDAIRCDARALGLSCIRFSY